jgi:hypothetical protein
MADRAKHAFGALERVDESIANGVLDAYDVLFVKDENGKPYVGWIDKNGNKVIVDNEVDLSAVEAELATKADATEVDAKVEQAMTDSVASANAYTDKMVEAAMGEHLTKKYEVANVPDGTLVDYRENEIRIMCKSDAVFTKQDVGAGGDASNYYMTFKTYAPDGAVGYIEHLGSQVDKEVLTDLKTDKYGRKYQPTWLGIAKYDEVNDTWTYYGKGSTVNKYIGWDYQIDWYDSNGVMIASDSIRINLSNENCHSEIKPYYVGGMMKEVEAMVNEKIAEVDSAYEIIEF